jgi:alkanesulfonate monooxygenase SsuD/methylene tetrahydromethanopterin reductase-like flavin-dependent oxidoreductase (luciferase family)
MVGAEAVTAAEPSKRGQEQVARVAAVRHALFLPIFDALADPIVVARLAAEAEEAGWDGVFVWDHIAYRPPVIDVADPWITLAAIAAATERVRLGPMITPLPRRRPADVARQTATLDRLSDGRLTLGVGIGSDNHGELTATGEQLNDRLRGEMLDESLQLLTAAWSGEPVHHRGPHYTVEGISFRPRPVQEPGVPVWVAVRYGNARPLRRAARHDGVFPVGIEHPDQLAELVASVATLRAADGATAATTPFDVAVGDTAGADPAAFAAAGATWWMVGFDWQATDVAEVRAALRDGPPTG